MAKKTASRATKTKRAKPAAKRNLVRKPKAIAYAKRTATGRFKEKHDVGASQAGGGVLIRTAEWAGSVAGYASSRVAKGVRAAAATIGLAQDPSSGRGSRASKATARSAATKRS